MFLKDEGNPNDEKQSLLRSGTTPINYQTILTVPYAHVIRDDKIPIESSNVVESNAAHTYWLFNGMIPDQAYEKPCFSFDDVDVPTPVVFTTKTTNGHFLFERLFQINPVNAINSSAAIRMHQINQKKSVTSSTVSMARPFDEFLTNPSMPNTSLDVQSNSVITKSDTD
ncbi:unnamed protein product [Rotaria sp. Silwood1]|nr:unnamed protein product [Rotaria sp. Silwood1]CAF1030615.1 unnamed protein product [Rotaria sp. Silwood1]CAF4843894.1 unnamed protein product [Rotaria sp. Silwood1]CAF4868987.1 unnamed protein product [Rotaria sp. Silwood1]